MNTYFRFEQPWFLLLAGLLPLFWFIGRRFQRPPVIRFAAARIFERATTFRRSWKKAVPECALLLRLCLLDHRPWPGHSLGPPQVGIRASGIDIMILLDVSLSMLSEDFSIGTQRASRLEVVKQVTEKFISGRPDDRIGIIAFSGRAYLVSPLTLDHTWLVENLARLNIRRIGDQTAIGSSLVEDGTAIGSALATAANRLRDKRAKSRVIVLAHRWRQQRRQNPTSDGGRSRRGDRHQNLHHRRRHERIGPFPALRRFWEHLLLAGVYAVQRRHLQRDRSHWQRNFLPSLRYQNDDRNFRSN